MAFFSINISSRVINLLLTKLARDCCGRISALSLICMDLTVALNPYCQELSQYGPRAWLYDGMTHASSAAFIYGVTR